jgi:hypothetical protein
MNSYPTKFVHAQAFGNSDTINMSLYMLKGTLNVRNSMKHVM